MYVPFPDPRRPLGDGPSPAPSNALPPAEGVFVCVRIDFAALPLPKIRKRISPALREAQGARCPPQTASGRLTLPEGRAGREAKLPTVWRVGRIGIISGASDRKEEGHSI